MSYQPSREPEATDGLTSRTKGRLVVALVLVVLLVIFVAQNSQRVRVNVFTFDGRMPLWLALLVAAVLGWLIGQLIGYSVRRARTR